MVEHITTIYNNENIINTNRDYSIADDNQYVHSNNNESTKQLYGYIKKLAIEAYTNLNTLDMQ